MKLRWIRLACLAAGVLVSQSLVAQQPPPSELTSQQESLLPSVLDSLKTLKSDPAQLAVVLERISEQERQAQGEVETLNAEVAALESQLGDAEKQRADLSSRLEALEISLNLFRNGSVGTPATTDPATEEPPTPSGKGAVVATRAEGSVDFNKDIRHILSNKCFACHGPDEKTRKAGLRLDDGVNAFETLKSGNVAIAPGSREKSELWKRISTPESGDRMPPASFDKHLAPEEIEVLGQWIDQGAAWKGHWAFTQAERPSLPGVSDEAWVRNELDTFILARLEEENLKPSPEADRRSLIRRLTCDLTGLPPTPGEIEVFLNDSDPKAYEKLVDGLLARQQYGEHQARHWLDLARYADTNGYHIDNARYMWPWRNWVIEAFNTNLPFNQFTLEQIAGDLLPNPTVSQKVASGFNRNHMITFEGGVIDEEYRVQYVVDRVNTTGSTWLGLTIGCAQCHDHKYDPISQKEYYQFFAFFNTLPEKGIDGTAGNASPLVQVPSPDQEAQLATFSEKISQMDTELYAPDDILDASQVAWESSISPRLSGRWKTLQVISATSTTESTLRVLEDGSVLVEGATPEKDVYEIITKTELLSISGLRIEALTHESLPGKGTGRAENSNFVMTDIDLEIADAANPTTYVPITFTIAKADFSQAEFPVKNTLDDNAESGWAVQGMDKKEERLALFVPNRPFGGFSGGTQMKIRLKFESPFARHGLGRFRLSVVDDPNLVPSTSGPWYHNGPFVGATREAVHEKVFEPENVVDLEATYEDGRMKWIERPDFKDDEKNSLPGKVCANYLYKTIESPSARTIDLSLGSNDSLKVWVNSELLHDFDGERGNSPDSDRISVPLKQGTNHILLKVVNGGGQHGYYYSRADEEVGEVPFKVETALYLAGARRSDEQKRTVLEYFRKDSSPDWRNLFAERTKVAKERKELESSLPTSMVMAEMEKPRETFMLDRGEYDKPTDKVTPAIPAVFALQENESPTRLDLANWLIDPRNPLTARVTVNRFWQQIFGTGIVKTSEDFGIQGEWPTHPELLDWLATEFVQSGWDVKQLVRMMVTSATYRQASRISPELLEKDPENRLLARGSRYRLDAEVVRDSALATSGLLVGTIGGPSVKPYQPEGIWEEVAFGGDFTAQTFEQDMGENLYRRSMYTFWKRQCAPPSMLIFDAPTREVCLSRRPRTNTPLQALTLMNDPQFVEAARVFGQRIMNDGGETADSKIRFAFELATSRIPDEHEIKTLLKVYEGQLGEYKNQPDLAVQLISVGESEPQAGLDPCDLAAWTSVASVILNLDETITKR